MNPETGLSVYFKTIRIFYDSDDDITLSSKFYNSLASVMCECIDITGSFVFQNCAENLSAYLPGLLGLKLNISNKSIKICDFLSTFK